MPGFAGLRGTGDWSADERPKNFREMILWLDPNGQTPLTALMAKMKTEKVNDPEFSWWEEVLTPVRIAITADLAAASTTITTTAGGLLLQAGDVMLIEKTEGSTYDNEVVVVSSVTNDTTFVVQRGRANTTAAGVTAVSALFMTRVGTVFEEGTRSPNFSSRNPTKQVNYTQIFKKAVEITNTAKETKSRTGDPWANDKKRKSFDHAVDLEYAFLWGRPYEVAAGPTKGKPMRFTGGLRNFLSTNVKAYTTTPTETSFVDFMAGLFNYSGEGAGDERLVLCGNGFMTSLNRLVLGAARTSINFDSVIKEYGMNLQKWILPMGTLGFKTHPLFNVHSRWNYSAFIINPRGIIYRPLRDTKFMDNIQENDEDEQKAQWLTEAGLEVHHERTMGYMTNFVV